MRQVRQKADILMHDLIKYSLNMGIPRNEIPTIVWDHKQFASVCGYRRRSKRNLGRCSFTTNTILVDIKKHLSLRTARHTLAHELVHARWQKLRHGNKFDELTLKVIRGTMFPMREAKDLQTYYNRDKIERVG